MKAKFLDEFDCVEDIVGKLLDKIQAENAPIVLYGAGYCLKLFLDLLDEANLDVKAIVDKDCKKWGKTVHQIEINSWEKIKQTYPVMQVVIATSHFKEIENELREEGFLGNILYLPLNAYYKNSVYGYSFLEKYEDRLQKVYEKFADNISRKVFINILKHNMSFDDQYFANIEEYEIIGYFGTELFENKENEVIIDGGAFDGDTIREFFSVPGRKFKKIYAFEPDTDNYKKLCAAAENDKIVPIHAGLGKEKAELNFIMGRGVSSRVDKEGTNQIAIEAIDQVLKDEKPTYIKMDIEGAEADALLGGRRMIEKYLPVLAISAYHKMRDMFELVELIDELGSGNYDIYLRHTFYYQKVRIQPDVIIYAKRKIG